MWDNSVGNKMALTFLLQIIMIFRDSVNRLREETEKKNSTKLFCDDCCNKLMWDNLVGNKMALTFLLQIIMIYRDSVNRLLKK